MERTIRLHFNLVGCSYLDPRNMKTMNAPEAHRCVMKQIAEHFRYSPVHISSQLNMETTYPDYYSAGWFISGPISSGSGSELVIVAHGQTQKTANQNMLSAAGKIDWNTLARDYEV